jgi:hypothetical protein
MSFASVRTSNIICFFTCSTISSVLSRNSQHTLFYGRFDGKLFLQSQLIPAIQRFFHMLDAQIFLQSQLVPAIQSFFFTCSMLNYFFSLSSCLATHSVVSHVRCSEVYPASAPNLEWTRVWITLSLTQSLKHMKEVTHRKIIWHSRKR